MAYGYVASKIRAHTARKNGERVVDRHRTAAEWAEVKKRRALRHLEKAQSAQEDARELFRVLQILRLPEARNLGHRWPFGPDYLATATLAVKALYRASGGKQWLRTRFEAHVDIGEASESDRALLRCLYGDPERNATVG